MLILGLIVLTG